MSAVGLPRRAPHTSLASGEQSLAVALLALAAGLAVVALLGPLLFGVIDYRVSETLRNQTIGLDAVPLFLVVPVSIAVALLALRKQPAAPALALGPAAYSAYMSVQYVLGPEYLRLPGNNERFFVLFLFLFVLAGYVGAKAWQTIDEAALPPCDERRQRRIGRVLLPLVGFFVFVRYIPALIDAAGAQPSSDYRAGPTFFWTIALLDLGLALPTLVAAAVGLTRRRAWARKALWLVSGWLALVGPAVAGMSAAMYVNDDANASLGGLALMSTLALALVAFAVYVYRPLWPGKGALQ